MVLRSVSTTRSRMPRGVDPALPPESASIGRDVTGERIGSKDDNRRFQGAGQASQLRDDLDVDFAFVLHGCRFGDGAERIGDAALLTDDFAQITRRHPYFIGGRFFLRHFGDVDLIRLVDESFYQVLDQVFQRFLLQMLTREHANQEPDSACLA